MYTRHWITLGLVLALSLPTVAAAQNAGGKALATKIANTIRDSGELKDFRIGVRFVDGKAVLLGEVTDPAQAEAAMRIAKTVAGVESVENELEYTRSQPQQAKADQPMLAGSPGEDSGLLLALSTEEPAAKPTAKKLQKPTRNPKLNRVASRQRRELPPAPQRMAGAGNMPRPVAYTNRGHRPVPVAHHAPGQRPVQPVGYGGGGARPAGYNPGGGGATGVGYTSPNLPGYAWPSYAAPQNYSALTYPRQYSPTAWPYIGPFYPYPQVPLGWRKVALEWDDGWWFLDFSHHQAH